MCVYQYFITIKNGEKKRIGRKMRKETKKEDKQRRGKKEKRE